MKVENYTQGYDSNWIWGTFQKPDTISRRVYDRILRQAKNDYLDGFGIDWSKYDEGNLIFDNMITCQAEFTNKLSGQKILLTYIWFDKKTGEINQAGTQYGSLTF